MFMLLQKYEIISFYQNFCVLLHVKAFLEMVGRSFVGTLVVNA
jgi:hypothetical protein